MRFLFFIKPNRIARAHVLAAMGNTPAAGIRDYVAADRTFVTGNIDDLDDIGVVFVTAHRELDTLRQDRPFFIYAAAHGRFRAGRNLFRNITDAVKQTILKRRARNLTQDFVFNQLNFGVKFVHHSFSETDSCTMPQAYG